MNNDKCDLCGLVRDRNSKYCRDCWDAMGRRYDVRSIRALSNLEITITQKRRCASCRLLPKCIATGQVFEGCKMMFKSLQSNGVKDRLKAIGAV